MQRHAENQAAAAPQLLFEMDGGGLDLQGGAAAAAPRAAKHRMNRIAPSLAHHDVPGMALEHRRRSRRGQQVRGPVAPRLIGVQRRVADGIREQESILQALHPAEVLDRVESRAQYRSLVRMCDTCANGPPIG